MLDIGILMGSKSQQIFMEQVDLYPGARHFYDVVDMLGCNCGRESCSRDAMQNMLNEVGNRDRAAAARFIDAAESAHSPIELKELLHHEYHKNLGHENRSDQVGAIKDLFRRLGFEVQEVSMVADEDLVYDPSLNHLGNDEPEHGGPPKE